MNHFETVMRSSSSVPQAAAGAWHPGLAPLWAHGGGDAAGDDDDEAAPGSDADRKGTGARKPDVLLVEDNHINQVVALEFLGLMGVQARLAKNGLEALQACAETPPDLILMDIQMPGMDGLECTRRLRDLQKRGELPPFPILALTAHALDSDVTASMEAGMDEHLTKPLDFAALRARLGKWLKLP